MNIIFRLKTYLLNLELFKILLTKIYNLLNKDLFIYKNKDLWFHKSNGVYLINFHPVLNFSKFKSTYKNFTKEYTPKINDIIFDVGSGLGQEVVHFSKKVGKGGKIFSIESDPRLCEVIEKLIIVNNLKNVCLIRGFFNKKNNISITSKLNPINEWMSNSINLEEGKIFKTKTVTIDHIIKKFNLKKISFAKFNIEGSEKDLMFGNDIFLKKCENICISCHDFLEIKEFRTFNLIKKLLIKNNFKIQKNLSNDKILKFYIYAKKK